MDKVTLDTIIDIENVLLMIEDKYLYDLSLNNILRLDNLLQNVGLITNKYFNLTADYTQHLKNFMNNLSQKEKDDKFTKFNNRIVNEVLDFDVSPHILFIKEITSNIKDKEIDEKVKSIF